MEINNDQQANKQLVLSLDYRIVTIVLVFIVLGMLALWQPWQDQHAKDRTIEVTGQATVTATPDSFTFSPVYEFKNADKQTALAALTKKSDEVVSKLRALGVPDNKIKVNSDSYNYITYNTQGDNNYSYSLRLTVTVDTKDLAQKVQDYIVTTSPTGAVSPNAGFSEKKKHELESQARNTATKEARSKAEQSAKNLGFRLGSVKTVNDGAGFGGVTPMARGMMAPNSTGNATDSLAIQPGENDLNYSVTVTYFVK